MNKDEFAYQTIASWCAHRDRALETTALWQEARPRISGSDASVQEAIRTVRPWTHTTI